MSLRPQIVAANKTDITGTEEAIARLKERVNSDVEVSKGTSQEGLLNPNVFEISAATGKGLDDLNMTIAVKVKELREKAMAELENNEKYDKVWRVVARSDDSDFSIEKVEKGVYRVFGTKPVRAVVQTDLENEEAVIFLQHRLRRMGVETALHNEGAVDGDEIIIAGRCFEYEYSSTGKDDFGMLD